MEMRRTERLFERYRAKGDLRALGEVFDRTAPELLVLASHLTREVADAEDVLQATFVTAIERAGSWDGERRLVPWLVGILVNHAKAAHRRAASRRSEGDGELDDVAVKNVGNGASGDPARRVAAAEVEALVADALRSLPAREREVLERHLVREERAVDIARALGRAPGTVRMQIHRGLERLRRALPPGTVAGLVPVLAHVSPRGSVPRGGAVVREAVLAHARVHVSAHVSAGAAAGGGSAGPAALSLLTAGGAIVSTKLVLSVIGALGAGVLGWVLLGPRSDVGALEPRAAARAVEAGAQLERPGGERPDATAPEAVRVVEDARAPLAATAAASAEPSAPPPGWYVVGRVAGLRDGDDATDVTINVHSFAARTHPFVGTRARPDGTFEVDVTPIVEDAGVAAQELLCSANHPLYVSGNAIVEPSTAELRRTGERTEWTVELSLVRASGVSGRVALAGGGAVHDVDLRLVPLEPDGAPAGDARELGCEEEDGAFDVRFTEHGSFALVAHADGFLPAGLRVTIPPETIVDVGTLELARGDVAIEGRVALPAGRTVRCSVHAVRDGSPPGQRAGPVYVRRATWDGERAALRMQRAEVDARGGFRLTGLVPGGWRLWADGFEGVLRVEAPPHEVDSDVVLAAEELLDARTGATVRSADPGVLRADAPTSGVVLPVGAAWLDVVVTADGTPLDGAQVEVGSGDGAALVSGAADGGRLALLFDAPGSYVVAAQAPGFERTASRVTVADGEAALVLELARSATGALELVADPALGEELATVKVVLERDGTGTTTEELVAFADGIARVDGIAAGRFRVAVEPGSRSFGPYYDSYLRPVRHDVEIEPGGVVRLAYAPPLGGRARIVVEGFDADVEWASSRFLGPDGREVDVLTVTRSYGGNVISVGASQGAVATHAESTTYPNLAPGLHQLLLEHEGWDVPPVAFTVVAGETVDVRVRAQRR